jgi:hypothetical protein
MYEHRLHQIGGCVTTNTAARRRRARAARRRVNALRARLAEGCATTAAEHLDGQVSMRGGDPAGGVRSAE